MKLKYYIWDIYGIAKENSVQPDVALDMFLTNIKHRENKYTGAKADYKTLGAAWVRTPAADQAKERREFARIIKAYQQPLSKAWQTQDRIAFDAVIAGV